MLEIRRRFSYGDLSKYADLQLYSAKRNGRNRVEIQHIDQNATSNPCRFIDPSRSQPAKHEGIDDLGG